MLLFTGWDTYSASASPASRGGVTEGDGGVHPVKSNELPGFVAVVTIIMLKFYSICAILTTVS